MMFDVRKFLQRMSDIRPVVFGLIGHIISLSLSTNNHFLEKKLPCILYHHLKNDNLFKEREKRVGSHFLGR